MRALPALFALALLAAAPRAYALSEVTMDNANPDGTARIADPDERIGTYFSSGTTSPGLSGPRLYGPRMNLGAPRAGDPEPSRRRATPAAPLGRGEYAIPEAWTPEHTRLIFGPFKRDPNP